MKASVIIPTYNRAYILGYCLKYILNQTTTDYEVIVVDDGSTDETHQLIAKLKSLELIRKDFIKGSRLNSSKLKYIRNERQQGQAVVRNIGIREAKGEIIIFVDSDVLVDRNFVKDHIEGHASDKLIVQGLVRHIFAPKDMGKFSLKIDGLSFGGLVTQNVSVQKKWLIKVGLMDEKFGITMGYEDTDLGRRLKNIGLRTVYKWRKCRAYHVDGYPDAEKFRHCFQRRYEWSRNIVYFADKYGRTPINRSSTIKTKQVFWISRVFQTDKWAEKASAIKFLVDNIDSPLFFITPVCKEIMKYHYRAKGLRKSKIKTQNAKLQIKI